MIPLNLRPVFLQAELHKFSVSATPSRICTFGSISRTLRRLDPFTKTSHLRAIFRLESFVVTTSLVEINCVKLISFWRTVKFYGISFYSLKVVLNEGWHFALPLQVARATGSLMYVKTVKKFDTSQH